jgi:hypothetical protein
MAARVCVRFLLTASQLAASQRSVISGITGRGVYSPGPGGVTGSPSQRGKSKEAKQRSRADAVRAP